jgi:hypothetical protein
MKISSYISIFDDWDLLKPSLWSIEELVDEIVVVDGAYDWMAPYLRTTRRDPTRSHDEVYDILASFGKKVRVVNRLWRNETEKRQAGYAACQGRYILRNDADEVLFWDQARFEAFVQSGHAVGQMEMPIYVSPGRIRIANLSANIERQSFLFDSQKISARQHLSYLWLVLPPDERESLEPSESRLIFAEPVAFTAHLTHWRSPQTAVNRARFYVMNFIRSTGSLPWVKGFNYESDVGFGPLFDMVSPAAFHDILLGHPIVAGPPQLGSDITCPSGRPVLSDRVFAMLYDNMLDGLTRLNDEFAIRPRAMANGVEYLIDATTNRSIASIQDGDVVRLVFSEPVQSAQAKIKYFHVNGASTDKETPVEVLGNEISFEVPRLSYNREPSLRRTIALTTRYPGGTLLATCRSAIR